MAQDYDKIFREVLKDIFPTVARKLLGIPAGAYKPLPGDLQYTSELTQSKLQLEQRVLQRFLTVLFAPNATRRTMPGPR